MPSRTLRRPTFGTSDTVTGSLRYTTLGLVLVYGGHGASPRPLGLPERAKLHQYREMARASLRSEGVQRQDAWFRWSKTYQSSAKWLAPQPSYNDPTGNGG